MARFRPYAFGLFGCFVLGLIAAAAIPKALKGRYLFFQRTEKEVARATSPDGAVDAVMLRADCGAPCASSYSVYVVPKGERASQGAPRPVFSADDMVDEKLEWQQPHLLKIVYARAFIIDFTNLSYPFGRNGDIDSWHYVVEIRLAPSSSTFSYIKNGL